MTERPNGAHRRDDEAASNKQLRPGGGGIGQAASGRRALNVHSVFMGEQGLRAGWACLLFLIMLRIIAMAANTIAHLLIHDPRTMSGSSAPPAFLITGEGFLLAAVLLVTYLMARLEHRSFLSFGLGDSAFAARFAGGLAVGFVAISALVGLLWSDHLLTLHGPLLHGSTALGYAALWGFGFLLVAFFEELLLRGYLLFTLSRGLGFWWSALLLSVSFGVIHRSNPGETPVGLFSAGAVGLLFCLSIWYTGSVWWAAGFHAAWDWGESFFWSTSDSGLVVKGHLMDEHALGKTLLSGGATGPEGSVFVFPVLLVCALLVYLWWRGKPDARRSAGSTIR